MRWVFETLGGIFQLARLAVKTRCRLRSAYWRWRRETAFGTDPARMPTRTQRLRAVIDYARWLHRMRHYR